MQNIFSPSKLNLSIFLLLWSALACTVLACFEINRGYHLWDEGFLWYGVVRTLQGEVPVRDFMAYDLGRYYWSAAVMQLTNSTGLISLRQSMVLVEVLTVWLALGLLRVKKGRYPIDAAILLTGLLLTWMTPYYRMIDFIWPVAFVFCFSRMLTNHCRSNSLITGIVLGLSAVGGRNHCLYGFIGLAILIALISLRQFKAGMKVKQHSSLLIGFLVGVAPLLLALLFIPGYAPAYWQSVMYFVEAKTTNLSLPVPWPWKCSLLSLQADYAWRSFLIGCFFVLLPGLSTIVLVREGWQAWRGREVSQEFDVLVCSAITALAYSHYAFSRADTEHLSVAVVPLLVGVMIWLSAQRIVFRVPIGVGLCLLSLFSVVTSHPGWRYAGETRVKIKVLGEQLIVDGGTNAEILLLGKLQSEYCRGHHNFLVAPFWPGAYPVFNARSPMWEIYALWRRPSQFQMQEAASIDKANPGFILLFNHALDGRDDRRFSNTHALIYNHIVSHYRRIYRSDLVNSDYQLFVPN